MVGAVVLVGVLLQGQAVVAGRYGADIDVADLLLLAVAFTLVGSVIAARVPANAFGWIALAIGALGAVAASAISARGPRLVEWVGDWSWWMPWALLPAALLVFPTGRLPSRRWRPALALAVVGFAVPSLCLAVASYLRPDPIGLSGPPATGPAASWATAGSVWIAATVAALFSAFASLVVRLRRSATDERRQVLCLLVGGAAFFLGILLDAFGVTGAGIVGAAAVPVAAGVAILWHRLYDLDLVINRGLVYLVLTTSLLVAYGATVWLGDRLLERILPVSPPLLAAAVVAGGLQPLRSRLQRSVDRVLHGERDPYLVVSELGRRLEVATEPAHVLTDVADAVAQALALPHVVIELAEPEGPRRVVDRGRPTGTLIPFPLSYRGEHVGRLLAAPRTIGGELAAPERRLLEDLARHVAVTAHAVRLAEELSRSREGLVRAREEERRRLRRDLHDGIGGNLAGVILKLGAGRAGLGPEAPSRDLVEGIEQDLRELTDELRGLIEDLRPPALDELGLVGALRRHADRLGNEERLSMTVGENQLPSRADLPAAVEVAAYRIAAEAMTNAARHSEASRCEVTIAAIDDALSLEVVDDGVGRGRSSRNGVGTVAVHERAIELHGVCTWESEQGGGTRVRCSLPLSPR